MDRGLASAHPPSYLTVMRYSSDQISEQQVGSVAELMQLHDPTAITWVHGEELNPVIIEALGPCFGVHPLVIEDILNTHQRPKFEEHGNHFFVLCKGLSLQDAVRVEHEQISLLVFDRLLFSFREKKDPLFDRLRQRLLSAKGRIRTMGADYLAYAIMDAVVDQYFVIADALEEGIESVEGRLMENPEHHLFLLIQRLKRELVYIRKVVAPLREVLANMQRSETSLIHEKTLPFFKDVLDHAIWMVETLDSYRDLINGMLDIHLTSISNRTNEIMKVLTVFTTIFTPLTFLVGIYGMNFDFMPELHWKWSYPLLWLIFLLIPSALIVAFRRRKWL